MLALLQSGLKPREARRPVIVPSRMKVDDVWSDVCIRNMSSRGLLVSAASPPAPGTYVDIRRGRFTIIGRVVWSNDRYFGVRTQDRLDIDGIVGEARLAHRPARDGLPQVAERRVADRLSDAARIERTAERSRLLGSLFEYGVIAAIIGIGSTLAAWRVYDLLMQPAAAIGQALGH